MLYQWFFLSQFACVSRMAPTQSKPVPPASASSSGGGYSQQLTNALQLQALNEEAISLAIAEREMLSLTDAEKVEAPVQSAIEEHDEALKEKKAQLKELKAHKKKLTAPTEGEKKQMRMEKNQSKKEQDRIDREKVITIFVKVNGITHALVLFLPIAPLERCVRNLWLFFTSPRRPCWSQSFSALRKSISFLAARVRSVCASSTSKITMSVRMMNLRLHRCQLSRKLTLWQCLWLLIRMSRRLRMTLLGCLRDKDDVSENSET